MKINFRKIQELSEKVTNFPSAVKYRFDCFKFYWSNFRWPKSEQWKKMGRVLNRKEKIILLVLSILFLASLSFVINSFYISNTEIMPAQGGKYTEGIVGRPGRINPVYADSSDVNRDLVEILFSGLMKYDQEGRIVKDLAENFEIKENGERFEVYLKPDIFWSDGEKITADDVIFTIETIQNPDYKSPLATNWLGIKVEKISERGISFKLKKQYSGFLERLTLKIIPSHIWENITPQNFPLSVFNLNPVGSGPFRLKTLTQDEKGFVNQIILEPNPFYEGNGPYFSEISFLFFDQEEELLRAFGFGEIDGASLVYPENFSKMMTSELNLHSFSLPRYFSVFFNLKENSETLALSTVREALNYGTDKKALIENILDGRAEIVDSPILPDIYGFNPLENPYEFNPEKAKEILEKAGFKENEEGIREKIISKDPAFQFTGQLKVGSEGESVEQLQKCLAQFPEIYPSGKITGYFGQETKSAVIKFQEKYYQEILKPWGFESGTGIVYNTTGKKLNEICAKPIEESSLLKFSLATAKDPLLLKTAEFLKEQWKEIGIEIEINSYLVSELEREIIRPRNFEMLLFGESLSIVPDPFPFWHSSQDEEPWLNLTGYENKDADLLLEEARTDLDPKTRTQKLQSFQDILVKDSPCVFLFNPDYLYFVSNKVKGIEKGIIVNPSKRLNNIENWYIKTKRIWKK